MKNFKSKPLKNFLISENFNHYDTTRHLDPNFQPPFLLFPKEKSCLPFSKPPSKSLYIQTHSRFPSEIKSFLDCPSNITDKKPIHNSKSVPHLEASIFYNIFNKTSATPKLQIQSILTKTPTLSTKTNFNKETQDFLNHLDLLHQTDREIKLISSHNKKYLHLGSSKAKQSFDEHNIYSEKSHKASIVNFLTSRIFPKNNSKKKVIERKVINNFPFPQSNPSLMDIKLSKCLKNSKDIRSKTGPILEDPLNLFLAASNFKDHKLLLEDLIKAIISLKKHKCEGSFVKLLKEIMANCKKLLDALIDKEKIGLIEPLTPRSLFIRLIDAKSFVRFNKFKSFHKFNRMQEPKPLFNVPQLDENFVKLLVDFKNRLQEASLNLQKEKFEIIKQSILGEYEKILEKEKNILQKKKSEGDEKKYKSLKKEFKSRLQMSSLQSGCSVGWSLRQFESNCGELVQIDKIERAVLDDLEKMIFSIQSRKADLIAEIK